MSLFLAELKRRKVYNVAAVYVAIGATISIAVPDLFGAFSFPSWAAPLVIVVIAVGFPIALVLAWAYEVKPEDPQRVEMPGGRESSPPSLLAQSESRPSLAVLPFANLSQDPENEFFGLGVMDDILTNLAGVTGLRLISRTSVLGYTSPEKNTREIAQELGVRHLLEGSIRRSGERVRLVAQLIDATTDEHLWATTYDRDLEDVFCVQTEMAESIALALQVELSAEDKERIRSAPTSSLKAQDHFSRALNACHRMLPEDLRKAEEHCWEAIQLDPDYAKAYAVLAQSHLMAGFYANRNPSEIFPKVREAANRALVLDPKCGEAHTALAAVKLHYEWDSTGVGQEISRALALNPDDSGAHFWQGEYLLCHGHFVEAEAAIRRALVSDPRSRLAHHNLAKVLALSGKPEEAISVCESAVQSWPDDPILYLWIGTSHFLLDELELALPNFEKAVRLSGALPFFESMRGFGLAVLGRRKEASEVLEDLKARAKAEYVDPYNLFQLTAALDGVETALPYLEEALEVRSFFLAYLGVLPPYRALHTHPRFRAVLNRVWPSGDFKD